MSNWYPEHKQELSTMLDKFLNQKSSKKQGQVHGIIVPHAGYEYSGKIAGKAFSLLKNKKNKTAIILSPSHYFALREIATHNKEGWKTPLRETKIQKTRLNFTRADISIEHAIDNQIPFLQKLNFQEVLPLLVGQLELDQIKETAKKLSKLKSIFIISTDLSHFLSYEQARKKDKETIKAIEELNIEKLQKTENNACGIYPLLIAIELCKIKKWKPMLIEYKNSGDITGDKSSVVGYASLVF